VTRNQRYTGILAGNDLEAATRILAANHRSAAFQPLTKPAAKSAFTTLFPNHVLIVKAIDVPAIDAFFHSSIIFIFMFQ
jgi:hypothetical protein